MTNDERAHEVAMLAVNYSVGSQSSKDVTKLVSDVYIAAYKSVMDASEAEPLPKLEPAKVAFADCTDYQLDVISKQLEADELALRAEYSKRSKEKRELIAAYAKSLGCAWAL